MRASLKKVRDKLERPDFPPTTLILEPQPLTSARPAPRCKSLIINNLQKITRFWPLYLSLICLLFDCYLRRFHFVYLLICQTTFSLI